MNIGMILEAEFPPDIRVEREARTLSGAGHTVTVMAAGREGEAQYQTLDNYSVHRFYISRYRFLKNLTRDYRQMRFIDPVWKRGIEKFLKLFHIDVAHVHDLPLVKTASLVCGKYAVPVVADYHENYPAQVEAFSAPHMKYRRSSYGRWSALEEQMSHLVDYIITVAQEYKDHLVVSHGVPAAKISVVQNTFDMDYLGSKPLVKKNKGDEFIISYVGSYGPHRGLDVVIRGMSILCDTIPRAKFVLVGKGRNREALLRLATEFGVASRVQFHDWVSYDELPEFFLSADIGVIPHHASEHTSTTIPNKIFEYMFFKVPLVVSDLPPLKRIVNETKAGRTFSAGDHIDFARQVVHIYNSPGGYGENGHSAVKNKYNWKVDGGELVKLYNNLMERKIS